MPNISQYNTYAQTALAAYATGLVPGSLNNVDRYRDADVDMTAAQAQAFDANWVVLQQSTPALNGFSAVLLQRKDEAGNASGAPMATSNSPTCGHPNSSRQDGQIIGV